MVCVCVCVRVEGASGGGQGRHFVSGVFGRPCSDALSHTWRSRGQPPPSPASIAQSVPLAARRATLLRLSHRIVYQRGSSEGIRGALRTSSNCKLLVSVARVASPLKSCHSCALDHQMEWPGWVLVGADGHKGLSRYCTPRVYHDGQRNIGARVTSGSGFQSGKALLALLIFRNPVCRRIMLRSSSTQVNCG